MSSLSGEKLRKLLETKRDRRGPKDRHLLRSAAGDPDYLGRPEDDSQDDVIDDETSDNRKEYIDCFVVASKQRMNGEKWIKSYKNSETENSLSRSSLADVQAMFTACVSCNMAFKSLDRLSLPPVVRKPREAHSCVFVLDNELTETTFTIQHSKDYRHANVEHATKRKRSKLKEVALFLQYVDPVDCQPAPPLPPKPGVAQAQPNFDPPKMRTKKPPPLSFTKGPPISKALPPPPASPTSRPPASPLPRPPASPLPRPPASPLPRPPAPPPPRPPEGVTSSLPVPPRKNRQRSKMDSTAAELAMLDAQNDSSVSQPDASSDPRPSSLDTNVSPNQSVFRPDAPLDQHPSDQHPSSLDVNVIPDRSVSLDATLDTQLSFLDAIIRTPDKSSPVEDMSCQPDRSDTQPSSLDVNIGTSSPDTLAELAGLPRSQKTKDGGIGSHYEPVESKEQNGCFEYVTQDPSPDRSRDASRDVSREASGDASRDVTRDSDKSFVNSGLECDSNETRVVTPVVDRGVVMNGLSNNGGDSGFKEAWDKDSYTGYRSSPRLPRRPACDVVDDESDSSSVDNYEAIDMPSRGSVCYLRPNQQHSELNKNAWIIETLRKTNNRALFKDDIVIAENGDVVSVPTTSQDSSDVPDQELAKFKNTTIVYDKDGYAYYVPSEMLKLYGDPSGEPWFYPLPLSSKQATLFLRQEKQEGCFVVYKPSTKYSKAVYNLSVCLGNGDVLHYHILEGLHGNLMIEGHELSFLNLMDLVDYFRKNKSTLATRLRRPLKEARLPITPGYHYDIHYELERGKLSMTGKIIGKGNFGVVCGGIYKGRDVAVKVLQGQDLAQEDEDDFIEEASVLMRLESDYVVKIIGVSCQTTPFFIVTEYVQHGNLKECLRNGKISKKDLETLVDVSIQMVSAMAYLESLRYILHRDVATRNFLVTDVKSIKLADFGRARFVNDDYYQAPRTEKISIKWAAPEVLTNFHYTTKSDVWALGVALWEVFTGGERPYESLSAEQTAVYVTEGGRLQKPAPCSDELCSILNDCWQHDLRDRPFPSELLQTMKSKRYVLSQPSVQTIDDSVLLSPICATEPKLRNLAKRSESTKSGSYASPIKEEPTVASPATVSSNKFSKENRFHNSSSSSDLSMGGAITKDEFNRGKQIRRTIGNKFRKLMNHSKSKDTEGTVDSKARGIEPSLLVTNL